MSSVTVTTSATSIIGANTQRQSLIISNTSEGTVFVGQDENVTIANGIPIQQNHILTETNDGTRSYMGPYYGVVETGTSDARVWERIR